MHEMGLVYIPTFEQVGDDEFSKHAARLGSEAQLKKIARPLFQMSVAMGVEPVGTVVAAQKCQIKQKKDLRWIFRCACVILVFLLSRWYAETSCQAGIKDAAE